jgi:molybdopterin synthase sulfur carrier subunit
MTLLYFAWVRERIGRGTEVLEPPAEVRDVAGLLDWLRRRGLGYDAALADPTAVRVAVNQEHAPLDAPVRPGDEVAIFPPVTGGGA